MEDEEDKNKIIDKRKYEKNIIINNKIMNDLINEQQNIMNYTKEIDINDEYIINDNIINKYEEKKNDKNHKKSNRKKGEINSNDKENKEIKFKINHEEEDDNNNIEPYKRMYKLAEYLYNYRCKVEENNITINIKDDDKLPKLRKMSSINKNENNITVNALKGKDITYLWYTEMKNTNNKSFNLKLKEDLDELLKD